MAHLRPDADPPRRGSSSFALTLALAPAAAVDRADAGGGAGVPGGRSRTILAGFTSGAVPGDAGGDRRARGLGATPTRHRCSAALEKPPASSSRPARSAACSGGNRVRRGLGRRAHPGEPGRRAAGADDGRAGSPKRHVRRAVQTNRNLASTHSARAGIRAGSIEAAAAILARPATSPSDDARRRRQPPTRARSRRCRRLYDDDAIGGLAPSPTSPRRGRIASLRRFAGLAGPRRFVRAGAAPHLLGLPADATDSLKEAADRAIAAIDRGPPRDPEPRPEGLLRAVARLGPAAAAIEARHHLFGVMGVINMAHAKMVMIGAYATFVVRS